MSNYFLEKFKIFLIRKTCTPSIIWCAWRLSIFLLHCIMFVYMYIICMYIYIYTNIIQCKRFSVPCRRLWPVVFKKFFRTAFWQNSIPWRLFLEGKKNIFDRSFIISCYKLTSVPPDCQKEFLHKRRVSSNYFALPQEMLKEPRRRATVKFHKVLQGPL